MILAFVLTNKKLIRSEHTGVNDTRSSRSLDTLTDGPLANLVGTSGEETGQVQGLTHGGNHLRQTGLGVQLLAFLESLLLGLEAGQALLEGGGDREHRVTLGVIIDPLEDFREVLVLLTKVVTLTQVDKVDNGLGSKELEGVDDLDLGSR
jgi:hypothetical protein